VKLNLFSGSLARSTSPVTLPITHLSINQVSSSHPPDPAILPCLHTISLNWSTTPQLRVMFPTLPWRQPLSDNPSILRQVSSLLLPSNIDPYRLKEVLPYCTNLNYLSIEEKSFHGAVSHMVELRKILKQVEILRMTGIYTRNYNWSYVPGGAPKMTNFLEGCDQMKKIILDDSSEFRKRRAFKAELKQVCEKNKIELWQGKLGKEIKVDFDSVSEEQ
jgi:hypothetical protein